MEQSRAIPVELQRAFDATLPMPLKAIFSWRYGLLPPVKEVRGQDGIWGQVGETRTVVTTDGGTMPRTTDPRRTPALVQISLERYLWPDAAAGRYHRRILGILHSGYGHHDHLAMDSAPNGSRVSCYARDQLDVAWLRTASSGECFRRIETRGSSQTESPQSRGGRRPWPISKCPLADLS